jgi:hypothetical protein
MGIYHLSAEEVAAYLDGHVSAFVRRRIETHLVHCDFCLGEVLAMVQHLRTPAGEPANRCEAARGPNPPRPDSSPRLP